MTIRRTILKAFCAAMVMTFPDFAVAHPVGRIRPSEVTVYYAVEEEIRFDYGADVP